MAPFQLEATLELGVTEVGIFASLVLFGIFLLQVYIYYMCSADRARVKVIVAAVLVLEMCHTIAVVQALYVWTVTLANVAERPGSYVGLSLAMVFETLITFLVQGYFIHRAYLFSQNAWVGACLGALCLLRLVGGLSIAAGSFVFPAHEPDYFVLQDRLGWLLTATFSVGASVDVFVAALLCVYVYRWKAAPTMKTTSQLIHRIMFWSIQTGLVTSLVSVVVIICFQTMKHNYVWVGVFAILGKLYSNSLLTSLNIRSLHRGRDTNAPNSFVMFSEDSVDCIERRDVEFAGGASADSELATRSTIEFGPGSTLDHSSTS
ncbi:hypothetical protein C8R44DRAFT_783288, partial [Mycena epipterygia]